MIVDNLRNLTHYGDRPALLSVVEFCDKRLQAVGDGTYDLMGDGSTRALVQTIAARMRGSAEMETHRRCIDIHTVIAGCEGLEWYDASQLLPASSYDEVADVIHYKPPKRTVARLELTPGIFVMLMPDDAHITGLLAGSPSETIRKVVFKIDAEKLGIGA